jgi:hypothetical protein
MPRGRRTDSGAHREAIQSNTYFPDHSAMVACHTLPQVRCIPNDHMAEADASGQRLSPAGDTLVGRQLIAITRRCVQPMPDLRLLSSYSLSLSHSSEQAERRDDFPWPIQNRHSGHPLRLRGLRLLHSHRREARSPSCHGPWALGIAPIPPSRCPRAGESRKWRWRRRRS